LDGSTYTEVYGGPNFGTATDSDITLVSGFGGGLDISEPCQVLLEINEFDFMVHEGDSGNVVGCLENGSFCQADFEITYGSSLPSFLSFFTDGNFTYTSPSDSEVWSSLNTCEMEGT
jgi:hypothetical protein